MKKPKAYWLAELEKAKITCGPMLNYDEVFTDPHVLAREMYITTEHAKAVSSIPSAYRRRCRRRRGPSGALRPCLASIQRRF